MSGEYEIVSEAAYSPAVVERTWRNKDGYERTDYACSWPSCGYHADAIASVSAHYRAHSGAAARRRRGERPSVNVQFDELAKLLMSAIDLLQQAVDGLAAVEEDVHSAQEARERLDVLRELLDD